MITTLVLLLMCSTAVMGQTAPRCCCLGPLPGPCTPEVDVGLCEKAGGVCETAAPTLVPSNAPSSAPTNAPSSAPTSSAPTSAPSSAPSTAPTDGPTNAPTNAPSDAPTTLAPTSAAPTNAPTTAVAPTTARPTAQPGNRCCCFGPFGAPGDPCTTNVPVELCDKAGGQCEVATSAPTDAPTNAPTDTPTAQPTAPTDEMCCCIPFGGTVCQPAPRGLCDKGMGICVDNTTAPTSAAPTNAPTVAPTATPTAPFETCCCIPFGETTCTEDILVELCDKGMGVCVDNSTSSAPTTAPVEDMCCCIPFGSTVCQPAPRGLCDKGMGICVDNTTAAPVTPSPTTADACCCFAAGVNPLTGVCVDDTPTHVCTKGGGMCRSERCCCVFDPARPQSCQENFPVDLCGVSGFSCLSRLTLTGVVYSDLNGNGARDAGEPPLSGVSVLVVAATGDILNATTRSDGTYSVEVPAGGGTFGVQAPMGATLTQGSAIETYSDTVLSFVTGFQPPATPGSLSGTLFNDLNADGVRQAGEPALEGVQVTVLTSAGTTLTLTTDALGFWSATMVPVGPAVVTVVEPTVPLHEPTATVGASASVTVPAGTAAAPILSGYTQGLPCCCYAANSRPGDSCVPNVPSNLCVKGNGSCQPSSNSTDCCCYVGGSSTCIAGIPADTCNSSPNASCEAPCCCSIGFGSFGCIDTDGATCAAGGGTCVDPNAMNQTQCCCYTSSDPSAECLMGVNAAQCIADGFSCSPPPVAPKCDCQPVGGVGFIPNVTVAQCTAGGQGTCIVVGAPTASPVPTCCCYSGFNPNCIPGVPTTECASSGGSCTPALVTPTPGYRYSFSQIAAGGCVTPPTGSVNYADVNLFVERTSGSPLGSLTGNIQFLPAGFSGTVRNVYLMSLTTNAPVAILWVGTNKPTPYVFTSIVLGEATAEEFRLNPSNFYVSIGTDSALFPNGELQTRPFGDPAACPA